MSRGRHAAPDPGDDYAAIEYPDAEPWLPGTPSVDFVVETRPVAPAPVTAATQSPAARALTPGPVIADTVSYARNGRSILAEVSVHVAPGESLAVVGPSGSGKSSLLALLAGLEPPDTGSVRRSCARPGLILQGYGLVSMLTAAENVEVPLQAGARGRLAAPAVRATAAGVLDSVGLSPVADHLIEELSGGQQQRVAVARALAVDPDVVFADEVTAELDHEWKEHVVDLLLDVPRRGGIVVIATHDPQIAARCSTIVRLVDGRASSDT
ncbi:MAG TPA: ATP-binding cassette domain-containing protein [Jatrophihabitans sp.]|nr:ATP-binding cassette domain-containing protein [Jatrophihabitans sp.]